MPGDVPAHTGAQSTETNHATHVNKTLLSASQLKAELSSGYFTFKETSYSKKACPLWILKLWTEYKYTIPTKQIMGYKQIQIQIGTEGIISIFLPGQKSLQGVWLKWKVCTGTEILGKATEMLYGREILQYVGMSEWTGSFMGQTKTLFISMIYL